MTSAIPIRSAERPAADVASSLRELAPGRVPLVATFASVLAVLGDMLIRDSAGGLGFAVWIALIAVTFTALSWRADLEISHETAAWLVTSVVFATAVAWRDDETLQFFNACAVVFALLMAGNSANNNKNGLFARRLRQLLVAIGGGVAQMAVGSISLVFSDKWRASKHDSARRTATPPWARGALIALPVVIIFGSLLKSADPIFDRLFSVDWLDLDAVLPHVVLIGVLGWFLVGWARNALLPARMVSIDSERRRAFLGVTEIGMSLGALNVLFALFVSTQLGWFFGGERFLRATTGLTVAEYARRGFFQMVVVAALVVPFLTLSRAVIDDSRAAIRRHTALSLPIIGLVGAIIVSAALRLKLYAHFYGLTTDRFYPLVFMGWLAFVLCWLALTVLREWPRPFVGGCVISGLVTLAALNVVNPDLVIARTNVGRALRANSAYADAVDVAYLAHLSGEAASVATDAVLAAPIAPVGSAARQTEDASRCDAASSLLKRWSSRSNAGLAREESAAWRTMNIGERSALAVVQAHEGAIMRVRRQTCRRHR